jgi:hypothetical protein
MSIFKKFNDFKTNEEKERNIQSGHNCKSCYEIIIDKQKWGKPTLCEGCDGAGPTSHFGY